MAANEFLITGFTRREADQWEVISPGYVTTVQELERALGNSYMDYTSSPASRVTRLRGLPMPIHALHTQAGEIWDVENGWRNGQPKPPSPSQEFF